MSIQDSRAALADNSLLRLGEASYYIEKVIGYGGSCIVYKAKKIGNTGSDYNNIEIFERSQIIKEFYPASLCGCFRDGYKLNVSESDKKEFNMRKEEFLHAARIFEKYYEYDQQFALPRPFDTREANGTVYIISEPVEGNVLSKDFRKLSSLQKVAEFMRTVCIATKKFHDDEYLYLDYKPDNLYLREIAGHYSVGLFDFDSIKYLPYIKERKFTYSSCSEWWSPPEQAAGWRRYKDIGKASDIYSIGTVFFWLLSGKPVSSENPPFSKKDLEEIEEGKFNLDKWSDSLRNKSESVKTLIMDILRQTLAMSSRKRLSEADKLEEQFFLLEKLTDDNPEVISHMDMFEEKAAILHRELEEKLDSIKKKQDEINSLLKLIVGKKIIFIAIASAIISALIIAMIIFNVGNKNGKMKIGDSYIIENFDDHILLALHIDFENAVHSYEMGINSWRRLMYNDAEIHIKEAADKISKHKGQSDIEVAKINNSLGCLYIDMGEYNKAYDYLNSAYITFKDKLGAESLEARATKAGIAQYDYYTGNFEKALTETKEIIDQSDPDKEKAIVAGTNHFIAMVLDDQGKYDESLDYYYNTLDLFKDFLDNDKLSETLARYTNDPNVDRQTKNYYITSLKWIIFTYNNIGRVFINKGDYERALSALEMAKQIGEENIYIGKKNLISGQIYKNLAMVKSEKGELKEGLDDIETSIAIQRNLFEFEDRYPGLIEAYDLLGKILEQSGDDEKAFENYEKALRLSVASFGENHPRTAVACNALGSYYVRKHDDGTAVMFFERAIAIRKAVIGISHPDTAEFYYNLALAYERIGNLREASVSSVSAKKICENLDIVGDFKRRVNDLTLSLYKKQNISMPFEDWIRAGGNDG